MKKVLLFTAIIVLLTGLIGCGQGTAGQVIKSNLSRETPAALSQSAMAALVDGNSRFALDLYQQLAQKDGNIFFSPYSLSQALAMTYAGAKTETSAQMAATLHFPNSDTLIHSSLNALSTQLAGRGKSVKEGFKLNIVNAIWGQKDYTFLPSYLDTLAVNYGAGLRTLDFIKTPEDSRLTINNWVSDQTANRIQDLLPAGSVNVMTRLVLTDAIYFKAGWKSKFRVEDTHDGIFNLTDNSNVNVKMMSQTANFGYYAGNKYQAVE